MSWCGKGSRGSGPATVSLASERWLKNGQNPPEKGLPGTPREDSSHQNSVPMTCASHGKPGSCPTGVRRAGERAVLDEEERCDRLFPEPGVPVPGAPRPGPPRGGRLGLQETLVVPVRWFMKAETL